MSLDLTDFKTMGKWWRRQFRRKTTSRVLVVEDDESLRLPLVSALYKIDPELSICWVGSAEEAEQSLLEEMPDLLISDCLLGSGETGMALWRRCQKRCPGLPFLMMTGLSSSALKKFGKSAQGGLPEVLSKPFYFAELETRVTKLLKPKTHGGET